MEPFWTWLALGLMVLGTLGTLFPLLPGLPLVTLVALVYGWREGFVKIDTWFVTISIVLTVLGLILEYISGPYVAKKLGATKAGVWGALLGGIAGLLFLGPLGLLFGPFLGAVLGEMLFGKDLPQAAQIGFGSMIGTLLGNMTKFILALFITVWFSLRVF
ncbi:MAG: hypothetical protein JG781_780 [Peptococcaceae bacterium]|jgi:hypothetical protein|nr:hypothetical protein [Peptococcaceae bacterium]